MKLIKKISLITGIALVLAAALAQVQPAAAGYLPAQPPTGFYSLASAPGVELYRKEYPGGTPDYVLVIHLDKQASLVPLTGSSTGTGADPLFSRQSLEQYWNNLSSRSSNAFCVLSGVVFSANEDPAALPLGLKSEGQVIDPGLGSGAAPGEYLQLEIGTAQANIQSLGDLAAAEAATILGGYSPQVDQDADSFIGRTFAGVEDADGNGQAEQVLFLVSKTSSQADATAVLEGFGADQMIMLGNGDAAQLRCGSDPYVYADQTLPAALGVLSGKTADFTAEAGSLSQWPVIVEGQTVQLSVEVKNTGLQTWQPGEVVLVNQRNPWGASQQLSIDQTVAPGKSTEVTWNTETFANKGVFTTQWDIVRAGISISTQPITISVIVIPPELESRKAELETQVRGWAQEKLDNIEALVLQWIQAQVRKGIDNLLDSLCPSSALLPGVVIAVSIWLRRRIF